MIYVASQNVGKLKEFAELLKPHPVEGWGHGSIPETGKTYQENALLKLAQIKKNFGVGLADDSGLEVHGLNFQPGIHSARWGEPGWDDKKRCLELLKKLEGVRDRRARFVCVLAARDLSLDIANNVHYFTGTLEGTIGDYQPGLHGFGYDPIFYPLGSTVSFANLKVESHRSIAVKSFKNWLDQR